MKYFLNNNTAVSFGYIVIAAFLLGATGIWIMFAPIFNSLISAYNVNIADGIVTSQNQDAMEFHQNIIYIVPIILLIGIMGWGYIRALEKRNQP